MSKTPHTNFRQRQRVLVILRDGTRYEDRFKERTGKFVVLEGHGKIRGENIRSITIPR